ncbi:hypothetical protein ABZ669_07060 [Streptomyces hirsutus]|uniref:hypothetical protein n=1 Tax=Streptomyces hirsutus TaxID=35620 RepID=UPI00340A914D
MYAVRRNSELAESSAKFHELWMQRKPVAEIAGETGLTQQGVWSRITRARKGYANKKPQDARADAAQWLDDVIRHCYTALHQQELKPAESATFLHVIAYSAVEQAKLYGPVTSAVPEHKEEE